MKNIRLPLVALAIAQTIGFADVARADIYTYGLSAGGAGGQAATLTIDTVAGTGSVIGGAINAAFTGNFSSFSGGTAPSGMFNIAMPATSTITSGGQTFYANATHQQMLDVYASSINLWSYWGSAACPSCSSQGDQNFGLSGSYTHTPAGTSVPEPGMFGLMGLGVAALAFRRRRGANVRSLHLAYA